VANRRKLVAGLADRLDAETRERDAAADAAAAPPAPSPKPEEAKEKKTRLGKGLGALFGEYLPDGEMPTEELRSIPVARIAANPFQPRREFDPTELGRLAASIGEEGLLQPLVVRPAGPGAPEGAAWELVAGERRWRAVRQLGWSEVPVVVKQVDDRALLVLAIVENIQRAELSPLEEAAAYKQLVDEFGFTQQEVAERVKKDRSTVANLLRLLQLPASVQRLVDDRRLSMGHARALLGVGDERRMADLAREAAAAQWSVREVEEQVRSLRPEPKPKAGAKAKATSTDAHLRRLEAELQRALGTAVRIRVAKGDSGRIEIPFYSADDFERVTELLLGADPSRV
jgi:ParB family transcriptional regulator, chromosome partitioning protein